MKRLLTFRMIASQKGVAMLEFAIVLPLLVLIFTGMIEYGRLMWHYDALAKATRDAARFLADEPAPITSDAKNMARTMVGNAASSAGVQDLVPASDVDVVCSPADCVSPDTVTVSVRYAFTIGGWIPVISPDTGASFNDVTLRPHTTMRYMR